jgi:hypothetical protein
VKKEKEGGEENEEEEKEKSEEVKARTFESLKSRIAQLAFLEDRELFRFDSEKGPLYP